MLQALVILTVKREDMAVSLNIHRAGRSKTNLVAGDVVRVRTALHQMTHCCFYQLNAAVK